MKDRELNEIQLHTNIEDTKDFQRLMRIKTEEFIAHYFLEKFRNGELKLKLKLIKETDSYAKDAKIIVEDIG